MRVPDPPASPPKPLRRDLTVEITRIDDRGRSGRRAAVAAVLVAGALGVAIVSGVLFPASRAPTRPSSSPVAAASVSPPSSPAPSTVETPTPLPTIPVARQADATPLVHLVRDGSLFDTLVLVSGQLTVTHAACLGPDLACDAVTLSLGGLDVPISVAPELLPWDRDPAAGGVHVLVAGLGSLEYLGSLVADVPSPVSITTLLANPNRFLSLPDLYPVSGWYLPAGTMVCAGQARAAESPGAGVPAGCVEGPYLLDDGTDPGRWPAVTGSPVAQGTGPTNGVIPGWPISRAPGPTGWLSGTFLVRRMYRPACDPASLAPGTTCDQLLVIAPQVVAFLQPGQAVAVPPTTAGAVIGQVMDSLGHPMVGQTLRLTDDGGVTSAASGPLTDTDGRFEITGLQAPDGWWVEVLESMPAGDIVIGRTHVQLLAGETTDMILVVTPGVALPLRTSL